METLILKNEHYDCVIGKMLRAKEMITYLQKDVIPFYGMMEKWERKEYETMFENYIYDLENMKAHIRKYEVDFNTILSQYKLSVSVFIHKYINE